VIKVRATTFKAELHDDMHRLRYRFVVRSDEQAYSHA
jgi:hypothetical protein